MSCILILVGMWQILDKIRPASYYPFTHQEQALQAAPVQYKTPVTGRNGLAGVLTFPRPHQDQDTAHLFNVGFLARRAVSGSEAPPNYRGAQRPPHLCWAFWHFLTSRESVPPKICAPFFGHSCQNAHPGLCPFSRSSDEGIT